MDALLFKVPPAAPVAQSVGASPWTYTNSSAGGQLVSISGGIVSLIEVNFGVGFTPFPALFGTIYVFPAQAIRITYAVSAPTVSMVQL